MRNNKSHCVQKNMEAHIKGIMRISDKGISLLKDLEGRATTVYKDVAGIPSIGYGHLLTRSELYSGKIFLRSGRIIRWKDAPLSDQDLAELLRHDLAPVEKALTEAVKRPLMQCQVDALACWTFNVGTEAMRDSTLLRKLNLGDYAAVPTELRRWNKAGGRVVQGLINRREQEVTMWLGEWHV